MRAKNLFVDSFVAMVAMVAVVVIGAKVGAVAGEELPQGFTETTVRQVLIETAGIGEELAPAIEEAGKKMMQGDITSSEKEVAALTEKMQKLLAAEVGATVISVSSDAEFADFIGKNPKTKVRRAAWALQKLYFLRVFILEERGEIAPALALIDDLLTLAPYSSDAYCERGYLLNMLKRPPEALVSYTKALELASNYSTERHNLATALRGQGFSLASIGNYLDAKTAYQKSLEYDPGKKIALDALASIAQLEKR